MVGDVATTTDADARGDEAPSSKVGRWNGVGLDTAVLFGLAGLAITQPMLDLFGNNPTFFVAGNYGRRNTVTFALVVAILPAVAVFAATAPFRLVDRRSAALAHGVGVGLLAALFGLVLWRTIGIDAAVPVLALAAVLGAVVAVAEGRSPTVRRFLAYLALGNLAFLVLFLFASPTTELLRGTAYADAGAVRVPALEGPVTVVVLDEFPLAALLRPDGTINEVRYPNLAMLAAETTWFRNASAEIPSTYVSVPEILSGVRSDEGDLPILRDHPRNLFTLFGQRYPINNYEVVTDMCPPDSCGRPPGQPLSQALSDAGVVYRHRVLPESMREDLPAVDQGWGDFGGDVGAAPSPSDAPIPTTPSGEPDPMARMDEVPAADGGQLGQFAALRRQTQLITADPSINLVHVLVPHHPYVLTPWGVTSGNRWVPDTMPPPDDPRHERAFAELYGMQAMQVAAIDQRVGEIVAHLEQTGAWDTGTFVLLSDHGIDITAPNFDRVVSAADRNEDGILRIPMFIKAPGQTAGEVRDEPATTLDVLPSLIDILDIEADWDMDGHSLFDGSEPGYDRALSGDSFEDGLDYVARQQAHLPEGDGWTSVLAIGEQGDLVGTRVTDHDVGTPSELAWNGDVVAEALADPAAAGGVAPVQVRGHVSRTEDEPPDLVVALDGTISATIGGYTRIDEGWAFTGLLGPEIEGGADEVVAYEVERAGGRVTLHPLVT